MSEEIKAKDVIKAIEQEAKALDPKEVESAMLERAARQVVDPMEVASVMYTLYLPKFKIGMRKLSSRARMRVLNYLVEYPLNGKEIKLKNDEEVELVAMGHAVMEAKFMMILSTMNDGMEQLFDAANPNAEPELSEEDKKLLEEFFNPQMALEFGKEPTEQTESEGSEKE